MQTSILRVLSAVAVACVLASPSASAQESHLGKISFPNSGNAAAQDDFVRGVLLLHSFEYEDAAEAFRAAQKADASFALAYWGEALTHNHPLWYQHDRSVATEILGRLAPTRAERRRKAGTEREMMYMDAVETLYGTGELQQRNLAYRDAMRLLHEAYPDDDEAAAFYALSILGSSVGGRDFAIYMRAAAEAADVFARNPEHPGAAHYLIHSFDDPIHAPLGLSAAHAYSRIAPDAAHALHMPSHIFVALGMWEEVAEMNVRSWQAGVDRVKRKHLDLSENEYHAILWNLYARLQLAEYDEAKRLLAVVSDHLDQLDNGNIRYHLAMMRAAFLVEADPTDSEVASIEIDSDKLSDRAAAASMFADAASAIATNDMQEATRILQAIKSRRLKANERADAAPPSSEPRMRADFRKVLIMEHEVEAMIAVSAGDFETAIEKLRGAAEMEESLAFQFGPPQIVKPSAELLGDVLVKAGRPAEAAAAYDRALERAPGRLHSVQGRARALASG